MQTQSEADHLFNAFNGRFFSEVESSGEIMHTIFLSQHPLCANGLSENDILHRLESEYAGAQFDRLPSCPACLEKLDNSLTGL